MSTIQAASNFSFVIPITYFVTKHLTLGFNLELFLS